MVVATKLTVTFTKTLLIDIDAFANTDDHYSKDLPCYNKSWTPLGTEATSW